MKRSLIIVFLLALVLLQTAAVLARSDDIVQSEIEAKIAKLETLRETQIEVHVEQRLVVLTGEVRFYEQKLISERIAWTTQGVYEVENELQVKPKMPMSDTAIERKIWEIIKASERFRAAAVKVMVSDGNVAVSGTFLSFSDPSSLKHKVAAVEGVIDIDMNAAFAA